MLRLELDDPKWREFVEQNASVPFHHPAWSRLISDCYGYRTFALVKSDQSGTPVAGVPIVEAGTRYTGLRWISLPFSDFCPPIMTSHVRLEELAGELDAERREAGVKRLQVRWELPGDEVTRVSPFVLHRLQLPQDPEIILGKVSSELRRMIRIARREGVISKAARSETEFVDAFYRLQVQTRRRIGLPVQPRRFFELLWKRMIQPGRGVCLLALAEGLPIAGNVSLAWKGRITGKHAASDARFWRLHPNHLLVWEAIAWGCENGFREFDFGRSAREHGGLREFKSQWRACEEPLVYSTLGTPGRERSTRAASALSAIIRHTPAAVCRLTGKVLYKSAA